MNPIDVTHRVGVSSFYADDWSLRYMLGCVCGDLVGRYRDEITAWRDGRAHLLEQNAVVDGLTFPVFPEVAAALKRRELDCVLVAKFPDGAVAVRDSDDPSGAPALGGAVGHHLHQARFR